MTEDYTLALAASSLVMADRLRLFEVDTDRKQKMARVVERKRCLLQEAFPEQVSQAQPRWDPATVIAQKRTEDESTTLLIELVFRNPFAPHELRFRDSDFRRSLLHVGEMAGWSAADIDRIREAQREALRAHHHINWNKIAAYGLAGLLISSTAGWLAAPVIGTALGSAAGLSGAAATAHGLALLGGGSLAAGGAGMAGGVWLVTGVGTALGTLGGIHTRAMMEVGAATLRMELVKLQVSYREQILQTQLHTKKAQEIVRSLAERRDEMTALLAEERELNESNSARLKDMEAKVTALEDAVAWMERE